MKIAVLQHDIAWKDTGKNLQHLEDMMLGEECADLYVLPEMFSTGFCTQPQEVAEDALEGQTLRWMKRMSIIANAAIAGSIAVKENGRYFNRLYFVRPDGKTYWYDKRHLFQYGGEDQWFTNGTQRVVAEFRGMRFLLQTCFDLRFPVWSRYQDDYDTILYVANWPLNRNLAWNTLLRARAIENQCFVAGANRVGHDPKCEYVGESAIIHPYGHELAVCPFGQESIRTAELDIEALRTFREKFPMETEECFTKAK